MTVPLTERQGMLLLGLVQGNMSGTEPDFARIVDELVALDCAEWGYNLRAMPTVLDAGKSALWAWLDPGTRADLMDDGVADATWEAQP